MQPTQYEDQKLSSLLEEFHQKNASGTLHLAVNINAETDQKSHILVWNNGAITYAGLNIPNSYDFAKMLVEKFRPDMTKVAIELAREKATNPDSVRELLEILVRIRVLSWEQIETFVKVLVVRTLERILPHTGQLEFKFNPILEFDLCFGKGGHGFDWSRLMENFTHRQQQWAALTPTIPSADAVPQLIGKAFDQIGDRTVRQHLQQWVDGRRSLFDIAEQLDKDPLLVARSYFNWVQMGWVTFKGEKLAENKELPTILSVDDSPIVQTTIKRILGHRYNLLLASNAVDALNLLNQKPVSLLLLDVTMPDIDGLEMCRTLRSIPKFSKLPIVMLTARDSHVDKLKGQIVGTNRYLTKPFDAEKLLGVVSDFVDCGNT